MKIIVYSVGKPPKGAVAQLVDDYSARVRQSYPLEWSYLSTQDVRRESAAVLAKILPTDKVVLLDESGTILTNQQLAATLETAAHQAVSRLVFIIGGAYGVDATVRERADVIWSLSLLVFPHQLVRILLAEQLYRSCALISGHPYHHS